MELAAYMCLLVSAFTVAFSLWAGRVFLAASLLLLVRHLWNERKFPRIPVSAWIGFTFCVVAVIATAHGVNTRLGFDKLHKLLWWVAIPVAAILVLSQSRLTAMISAFAVGTGALALEMFVRNPIQALACVRRGDEGGFMAGLMHIASMTDAQRLMMGIVATIGLIWVQRGKVRHNRLWFVLLAVQCVALTMTFKRGSWVCAIIAVVLFALLTANWKYVFALTLILSLAAGLAPVRSRVASLKNEFKDDNGGRMTMWFKIAPALIKEYPWGVGFGSVTPEMMRKIAPKVEPNRNHLHSNIFEVLVETGWLGLAVYILWMLWAFCDATIFAWAARRAPPEEMVGAFVVLLMLIGLLANGLVEYNFAEAQLVIPCGYLIGMAAAGRRFSGMRNVQSAHLNP